jgi:alkylated DNA repair dioxygenase AlkB
VSQQLSFFSAQPAILNDDATGRIVYIPGVFSAEESRELFECVRERAPWSTETMWMYDKMVDVPRLVAKYEAADAAVPPLLRAAHARVSERLGESFTRISLNYYRDENDSVAWHNDRIDELVDRPTVALLSLGAVRRMDVRSKARPRRTFQVDLEPGSLFVMSGRSQEYWEHAIPKLSRPSDARISIAFRRRRDERE